MLRFFDLNARVTFFTERQPQGSIQIDKPLSLLGHGNPDYIPPPSPLRRARAVTGENNEGIVYVSTLSGERLTHCDPGPNIDDQPGMVRVIAENPRVHRPLGANEYRAFVLEMRHKLFQRGITESTQLENESNPVASLSLTL